jgi:hypothetical protein
MSPPFQLLVQLIEQDIGEQRRERRSLRGSLFLYPDDPLVHATGGKIPPDQAEESFVFYPPGHSCHQHVVVNGIEEFFQVKITTTR